jgi:hypothetical protein
MDPEKQKEEEIEKIAGEVLNNMSIATALSILIEKSKEIAENYLETASEEQPQKKVKKLDQELQKRLFTEEQSLGVFDKIKKLFK